MIPFLEASLLRPIGLVVAAWLVLRVFRVQHPASRHSVWAAVLVGMLLLPIISVVSPRLTLPILPATPQATTQVVTPGAPDHEPVIDVTPAELPGVVEQSSTATVSPSFVWPSAETMIVGVYVAGFSLLAIYRLLGWALLRRVLFRSRSTRPSCLRESTDVVTPVAVGVLRPSVILPAGWRTWDVRTRRAVLAHEFAHLRRRDTLIAALARFTTSVFWFHPVAWWVARKTSDLAELACDAVALQRVGDPAGYSRLLVEFAHAVHRSGRRVALPGLAMASGSRINDRVDQVFEISKGTMRTLARPRVLLAAVGLPVMSLVCTLALGARDAEQTPTPTVKFDVVSIKPCPALDVVRPPGSGRSANPNAPQITPGYVHWDCVTLAGLIDQAWAGGGNGPSGNQLLNVLDRPRPDTPRRVRGGPSWVHDDRFTIEAKVSGDVSQLEGAARFVQVRDAMLPALRGMIEDRFQLKFRKATEQQPMYAMTVAKGGLKITQTAPQNCWRQPIGLGRGQVATPPPGFEGTPACGINVHGTLDRGVSVLEITHANLQDFAKYLSTLTDRYVLDKTGVEGRFSFKFEYLPDDNTPGGRVVDRDPGFMIINGVRMPEPAPPPPRQDGVSIFKALEALGLKLEPTRGPSEYLQIESVQRPKPNSPAFAEATAGKPLAIAVEPPLSGPNAGPTQDNSQARKSASTPQPKFDIVSIKPCPDVSVAQTGRGAGPNLAQTSPGHVYWACVTLAALVDQAYAGWDFPLLNTQGEPLSFEPMRGEARDDQKRVRGGPSWMYSERFTIEATASVDVINPPAGAVNLMRLPAPMNRALRALLEDRFQVKLRRETEERPMYALTVAKTGLKAKPRATGDCEVPPAVRPPGTQGRPTADGFFEGKWFCSTFSTAPLAMQARLSAGESFEAVRAASGPDRRYEYRGVTLQKVADQLAHAMDRSVIDKTGVDGEFLFAVEFKSDDSTPGGGFFLTTARNESSGVRRPETPTGNGSTIFQAFEAIGLKLEPTKGPAEYLLIESAQRPKPDAPTFAKATVGKPRP